MGNSCDAIRSRMLHVAYLSSDLSVQNWPKISKILSKPHEVPVLINNIKNPFLRFPVTLGSRRLIRNRLDRSFHLMSIETFDFSHIKFRSVYIVL